MKKLAIGVLSAGALAVAGALGTSYHMGGHIQQALEETTTAWSSEDGFSVRIVEYERGIVRSKAKTLWTFATGEEIYELPVTHDIMHGPWPMGKAAKVITRFALPADSEPQLLQALQEQPPLEWSTTASWSGETEHSLSSPQFTAQFEDGSTLSWGGLKAQWTLSAQRNAAKGMLNMPLLRVKVEDGTSLDMQDSAVTFDAHVPENLSFWSGPSSVKIGQLAVHNTETESQWQLQGLSIQSDTSLQNNLVHMALNSHVATLELPEFKLDDLALEMHAKQIDGQWLNTLMLWMQRNTYDDSDQVTSPLQDLPMLLAGKPEIALTRLGMRTPEGPAEMSARIAYVGQAPEAFNPATDLHVQMHAQLPKTILAYVLDSKVRSDYLDLLQQLEQELNEEQLQAAVDDGVDKRLQGLLELGAIKDSGTTFSADLELKQGELTLNGQPSDLRNLLQMGGAI